MIGGKWLKGRYVELYPTNQVSIITSFHFETVASTTSILAIIYAIKLRLK